MSRYYTDTSLRRTLRRCIYNFLYCTLTKKETIFYFIKTNLHEKRVESSYDVTFSICIITTVIMQKVTVAGA